MEVQVKITEILEPQSFMGRDGVTTYTRYSFVGTTFGDYPRVICFQTLGQDKFAQMNIQLGAYYTVSFDIESRLYNGKYFTSINAWKAIRENEQSVAQPQTNTYQAPVQPQGYPQAQVNPTYASAPAPINQQYPNNDQAPF